MAFTRVVGAGIHTAANINSHNIKSTGIITATKFDGPFDTLNVTGDVDLQEVFQSVGHSHTKTLQI